MYDGQAAAYVRHAGRTRCMTCGLQYMSGFEIILSIHLGSRQINWTGFAIILSILLSIYMMCGPHYLYDVQVVVYVRIWDYFIYLSAEQANKLDRILELFYLFICEAGK